MSTTKEGDKNTTLHIKGKQNNRMIVFLIYIVDLHYMQSNRGHLMDAPENSATGKNPRQSKTSV